MLSIRSVDLEASCRRPHVLLVEGLPWSKKGSLALPRGSERLYCLSVVVRRSTKYAMRSHVHNPGVAIRVDLPSASRRTRTGAALFFVHLPNKTSNMTITIGPAMLSLWRRLSIPLAVRPHALRGGDNLPLSAYCLRIPYVCDRHLQA